ncbi:hypothetical protein IPJ70_03040 [Candidatus Campbellbacteria bacterium]|nr:MAG: hypothetical protein IPJ70_03040 [Candidatus Campbellbacteria bacterium]
MFDADTTLSPTITDDDDLLSPWDDTDDTALPVEPDEEGGDLVPPKPLDPLSEEDEDDEEADEFGLSSDDFGDEEL